MLTGLQLEITHLKRRCQELSYELDSKFPDRNTAAMNNKVSSYLQTSSFRSFSPHIGPTKKHIMTSGGSW
ncbi:hypothetical protein ILYODFUR_021147 [Ilyodon furcidens]|uniref:Uncharacterized protein n=1 Tax=Ilyodon furcidens TaxID=33524 RepID=A0ABV0TBA9_9TELE